MKRLTYISVKPDVTEYHYRERHRPSGNDLNWTEKREIPIPISFAQGKCTLEHLFLNVEDFPKTAMQIIRFEIWPKNGSENTRRAGITLRTIVAILKNGDRLHFDEIKLPDGCELGWRVTLKFISHDTENQSAATN